MLQPQVLIQDQSLLPQAQALATRLNVAVVDQIVDGFTYIELSKKGLSYISYREKPHLKLYLDFTRGRIAYRLQQGQKEPLTKAFGSMSDEDYIIDATMGFAEDTVKLAHHHFKVTAFEENPFVFVLVEDAIGRANMQNISIQMGKSEDLLAKVTARPYAVYLDPMFGEEKSAKVKKEMQVLQSLTEEKKHNDTDLFNIAYEVCKNRVVVKRSLKAKPISDRKHQSLETKTIRFDIYRK